MTRYLYMIVDLPYQVATQTTLLNDLGNDGWELVAVVGTTAYFKRAAAVSA